LINGGSLSLALEDEELVSDMMWCFKAASSVIVYRSSPDEKAQVIQKVI